MTRRRLEIIGKQIDEGGCIDSVIDSGHLWLEDMVEFLYGSQRHYRQEVGI
jgi:hypothetical protein